MDSERDIQFMQRALQLANAGFGSVSPNPMVGCVIVSDDQIIGEGFHQAFGGPHAEVNAITTVKNRSLLKSATVYVTLEPCAHQGKTPPCADLLIRHQVKRVVIAATDPNPKVNGQGIIKIKNAGIDVSNGILDREAQKQNIRFNTFFKEKRPFIILKWAQTKDGFIARSDYSSKWISTSASRQMVHQWRTQEDAILIGKHTALYDNPMLTSRDWKGKNPVRIVLDRQKSLPGDLNLFNDGNRTLIYTHQAAEQHTSAEWIQLNEDNFLKSLLNDLHQKGIQSLIVEGGTEVLNTFISAGLWDEARVFIGETTFDSGIPAPSISYNPVNETNVSKDRLIIYKNNNVGWKN